MTGYLKRLLAGSAAYQTASIVAAAFALVTLPLYLRHLTPADYGYAETLLTFIILTSIFLRLGLGEAFVRFWFSDEDRERQRRLLRTTWTVTLATSTLGVLAGLAFADELSRLLLDTEDAGLMRLALLGLWAFTNLELAYAVLRVEERRATYVLFSVANVLLTVALTVTLVVGLDGGARGYLLGNYGASTVVLLALWALLAKERWLGFAVPREALLRPLLKFGGPTVPADATVFALNVIDRAYLLRVESPAAAGTYAVAVKLATAIILITRGFQAAWPPLAYSVTDDEEAGRLYALVTRVYVAVTGLAVVALALLGPFLIALIAPPEWREAEEALPWVALGWALYGVTLLLITVSGRVGITSRNIPAALTGLVVNVVALVLFVDAFGIAGAGMALCAAYLAIVIVLHVLTRRHFPVPFAWGALGRTVGAFVVIAVVGEVLVDSTGLDAFLVRCALVAVAAAAAWWLGLPSGAGQHVRTLLRRSG